jgi:hypothetical protein
MCNPYACGGAHLVYTFILVEGTPDYYEVDIELRQILSGMEAPLNSITSFYRILLIFP